MLQTLSIHFLEKPNVKEVDKGITGWIEIGLSVSERRGEQLPKSILFNAQSSKLNRYFAEWIDSSQSHGLSESQTIRCRSLKSYGYHITTWKTSAHIFLIYALVENILLNMSKKWTISWRSLAILPRTVTRSMNVHIKHQRSLELLIIAFFSMPAWRRNYSEQIESI